MSERVMSASERALRDALITLVELWEGSVPADYYHTGVYTDFTQGRYDATLDAADDLTAVLAQHMFN